MIACNISNCEYCFWSSMNLLGVGVCINSSSEQNVATGTMETLVDRSDVIGNGV